MNKTYIKRQLTLNKLGIPMNEDIDNFVNYFYEIIGDPNELIKKSGQLNGEHDGYFYYKNDNKLLFYDIKNNIFSVDIDNIWKKFMEKFGYDNNKLSNMFIPILEEALGYKVSVVIAIGFNI